MVLHEWNSDAPTVLNSALTTLQDYRIESGEPSGELKITEVPGLPENETAQAAENDGS
jgi:hypothetical protein